MTKTFKPRLRFFEKARNQQHIGEEDRYIYDHGTPTHSICVIGAGTIGQEHMSVAAMLGRVAVHGIYDANEASASVAAAHHEAATGRGVVRYKELEQAVTDPDVDAIMICTPNSTHLEVLEVAAKTGKPIFLEKPMATTVPDARRIVEIAESYPTFIQVGLQYRYKAPYVEAFHETLGRRSIGKLHTIAMSEYRPPFLDKVGQWNKFSEFSGGTLVEKCCHYFDLINLLAQSPPSRVFATGGCAVNYKDFERDGKKADIDDHDFVLIEYENGIRGSFTLNMFSPHFHEELVLCGERGRLVATETFDFHREDTARSTVSIELGECGPSRTIDVGYTGPVEKSGHHGATFFEHIAFADQLDGNSADCATPMQGLWSVIVASAAQESVRTGNPVNMSEFIADNKLSEVVAK